MAKSSERERKCNEKMFALMQKYNFDRAVCVRKFKKWTKKKGYNFSESNLYRIFDRVMRKCNVLPEFNHCVQQFYRNLARVEAMVVYEALNSGDIQDYLALLPHQMKALNLLSENNNVVLNQFNQQNTVNVGEHADEVLQRLQGNLERFAPLITRLREVGGDSTNKPILTIPATHKAENSTE